MPILRCMLVHRSGTIIRFTTSQLPALPSGHRDVQVRIPSGRTVDGHFNRNTQNPNVSGEEIVRWIKQTLPPDSNQEAIIDVGDGLWTLFRLPDATAAGNAGLTPAGVRRVGRGELTGSDLQKVLEKLDRLQGKADRRKAYSQLLRPPGLRRLILELMGASCQIDGCDAAETFTQTHGPAAGPAVVEVHHIEAVARRVDHHPNNLCVLCANHHRLIHGTGPWTIRHDGDHVVLTSTAPGGGALRLVRDFADLGA